MPCGKHHTCTSLTNQLDEQEPFFDYGPKIVTKALELMYKA